MKQTRKPAAGDQFHEAMQKALQLDKQLQPVINAVYCHLLSALQSDQDRALFQLYIILSTGADLSTYAPRYLLTTEMTFEGYLDLYTAWARKAEKLLAATGTIEPIKQTAARRKTQRRNATGPQEGKK